jgi:cytochrome c-type biogenesis protein CcmH
VRNTSLRGSIPAGRVFGLLFLAARGRRKSHVLAAALVAIAAPLPADSNLPPAYWANRQLPDARQEAEAQALMQELRCLVCQGQSIADSDAELAADMRDLVRRRVAAGEKPSQVRAWLIQRYGTWISYRPTVEPAAWPLWLAPVGLLLVGAWLIRRRLRLNGRD